MSNQNQDKEQDKKLKELVKSNLEKNQEILKTVKSIKRYIFWRKIFIAVKIALIAVPIVLGVIYLPPFLEDFYNKYQELFNKVSSPTEQINNPQTNQEDLNKNK